MGELFITLLPARCIIVQIVRRIRRNRIKAKTKIFFILRAQHIFGKLVFVDVILT